MKAIKIFMIMALSSALAGCSDWLSEDGAPKLTYDYYETKEGVDAAVVSAYSYLRWGCGGERFDVLTEMGTDLFIAGSDGNYKASFNMYGTQLNPDLDILDKMWENHYKGIGTANIGLERILNSELSESDKKQSYAEMLFIRAFLYFDLVQQFGRIPLVTKGSLEVRTDFKRASVEEVYKQIITDLRECTANLAPTTKEKGRATSYAAAHLLAKVYLTRGSAVADKRGQKPTDMDSALYYSEMVIKEGKEYQLVKDFADLWDINNLGNSEVIFAVQFTNNSIFNDDGNTFFIITQNISPCNGCRCTTMNRACSVTSITDVHINGSGQVKKRCSVYSTVKMTLVSIRVSVGHFFPTTRKQFLCGRSWKMAEACILPPILPKDKWKGKKSLH